MMKIWEKIALIATGVIILAVVLFNPIGCATTPTSPPLAPTQDIKALGTDITNTNRDLRTTTATIRTNANGGMKATPPSVQPVLNPFWNGILNAAGIQDQLAKNLDATTIKAAQAEKDSEKFEQDYNDEHKKRLAAEDSATKELRNKYIAYSGILFFASLILFGVAIWNNGNKFLLWGGVIAGVGSAVAIFIVQIVALIPWIVGGVCIIAIGFLIYSYIHNSKVQAATKAAVVTANTTVAKLTEKTTTLSNATHELVETIEATKPRMTIGGRVAVFGDGPTKGDAFSIQSRPTEALVKEIRQTIEKAPKMPVTVAIDWNHDGIVDDRDVPPADSLVATTATMSRKRILS